MNTPEAIHHSLESALDDPALNWASPLGSILRAEIETALKNNDTWQIQNAAASLDQYAQINRLPAEFNLTVTVKLGDDGHGSLTENFQISTGPSERPYSCSRILTKTRGRTTADHLAWVLAEAVRREDTPTVGARITEVSQGNVVGMNSQRREPQRCNACGAFKGDPEIPF